MKKFPNTLLFFLILLAALSVLNSSCNKSGTTETSEPCGAEKHPDYYISNGEAMEYAGFTNFIVNGEANVAWKISAANVCTAEHSSVRVSISVKDLPGIRIEATVLYGILRERPIQLSKTELGNALQYDGSDEFGIKDYYGDSPGEFDFILTMYFPSANTHWDVDSAFVADNVLKIEMYTYYNVIK